MPQQDLYTAQPTLENELVQLRPIADSDVKALLACYSDLHAVPFFNSDHCNGDDFHYTTPERVREAMAFWQQSYRNRAFVRWAVVDQSLCEVVGTVEMFHRRAPDANDHAGVLRIDLRSRFETRGFLHAVVSLCLRHFYDDFAVERILTKAVSHAKERRAALAAAGFTPTETGLLGYPHYFERSR